MSALFAHREFGVLLHPSSLAGPDDLGTFGAEAYSFVDWLAGTGAGIWQILPLTPSGAYDSPYFSYSAFAGNPWLVDLRTLHEVGLLPELGLRPFAVDTPVPFEKLPHTKRLLLIVAAETFLADPGHQWSADFAAFRERERWLRETAHFFAIKEEHHDAPWWKWPDSLRTREPRAIRTSVHELADRIDVWEALFFFADLQWSELRAYANARGVRVLGDLPIYVNHDSADVWLHQDQFDLDSEGGLTSQSGVPPDYFSERGQLWGNPLYRWDVMAKDGYRWWVDRLRRCLDQTDIVRLDHFRALASYWEIPPHAHDARGGRWVPGPGQAFFDVLAREFPGLPFVAEDLGTLDADVYRLRDDNALYGMRVLEFGFDGSPANPHLPHTFPTRCIAYTGTHDNQPVRAWWESLDADTRERVARYYQFAPTDDIGGIVWSLIEGALGSRADVAIIPVQDLLVLGEHARMNDPSHTVGNWSWRMPARELSPELSGSLRALARHYGRTGG